MNLRPQGCDGASNTGIPQTRRKRIIDPNDISAQIEITIREFEKGRSTKKIAEKYGLDPELTEHIIRLNVTHPGVTVDGIMTKMGL